MPVYFQKIPDKNFDPDGSFHVKDSRGCNLTIGFLFLAIFVLTIYFDRFDINHPSVYQALYLLIVPAVFMIRRGMANKIIMTINSKGFYYCEEPVTDWYNFIDAVISQDEENRRYPYDLSDRFMLFIRYGKIGHTGYYGRRILLSPFMDKSEEEIMAAIKYYYEHREEGMILPFSPPADTQPPNKQLLAEPLLKTEGVKLISDTGSPQLPRP